MKTRYETSWHEHPNGPAHIEEMIGRTMVSAVVSDDNETLTFTDSDGVRYVFYHEQDCCESVQIEDICGDLDDLTSAPIAVAEEVSSERKEDKEYESQTWTFYKFATMRGSVTVRWLGESNGYYSEEVYFRIEDPR